MGGRFLAADLKAAAVDSERADKNWAYRRSPIPAFPDELLPELWNLKPGPEYRWSEPFAPQDKLVFPCESCVQPRAARTRNAGGEAPFFLLPALPVVAQLLEA